MGRTCACQADFSGHGSQPAPPPGLRRETSVRLRLRPLAERDYLLVEYVWRFTHGEMAGILHGHVLQVEVVLRDEVGPVDDDAGIAFAPQAQRRICVGS